MTDAHPHRILAVDGLSNARDLGGLARNGGGRTPYGVFFRSECPHTVTPTGWEQLHARGIRTVVDLRQPAERERTPSTAPAWATAMHVDHDGLEEHPEFWADFWDNGLVGTALYYLPHLTALPHRSAAVLAALAQAPEGGVLFHCAGGRDRTGLIATLLLRMAGATPEAIVDDYLLSVGNGAAVAAARGQADPEPELEALCHRHGTTTEDAFREVVATLDLEPVTTLLSDSDRAAVLSWRGSIV